MGWKDISLEKRQAGSKKGGLKEREKKEKRVEEYNKFPKFCLWCKEKISYEKRQNNFCSRSCGGYHLSPGRQISQDTRDRISKTVKLRWKEGVWDSLKSTENKKCELCNKQFNSHPSSKRRYCSRTCSNKDLSKNLKGKSGGARLGSGRSKSGWYKGIYCGSTYELAWVVYNIDNDIPFERNVEGFPYIFKGESHIYYPDFKLPDGTFVEIKGFQRENDSFKWDAFPNELLIVNKDKCKKYISYVKEKYEVSKLHLLYGDKLKYSYTCSNCNTEYFSDVVKDEMNFCSRFCAGKYRSKIKHCSLNI